MKQSYFLILLLLVPFSILGQECLNAGFESGLADGYLTYTGSIDTFGNVVINNLDSDPNRFKVMSIQDGIDTIVAKYCTIIDSLIMVPNGGGKHALRLGNAEARSQAEKIVLTFEVTPDLTFFLLNYAVVLNDPDHKPFEQPRFEMNIFDEHGRPLECGHYEVKAAASIPGFESCEEGWRVRDWTAVGFELQSFLGETIQIEIQTTDCSQGAHAGYAYIDANCEPLEIQLEGYCPDSTTARLRVTEGFIKYEWGADSTNNTNILHLTNPIPESVYTVTVTSGTGCTLVLYDTIPATKTLPTPKFEAISDTTICTGDSILIHPKGVNLNEITNLNYNYSATSFTMMPEEATEYLFVSFDEYRCIADTLSLTVEVEQAIRSSFSTDADTYCVGDSIWLDYQSTGSNSHPSWILGDSSIYSGTKPPPIVYSSPTNNLNITLIDSNACVVDSFHQQVTILDLPNPEINIPPTVCVADTFLIESIDKTALHYHWSYDNKKIAQETVIEFAYETSGIDTIFLSLTDSLGCANTNYEVITVNPLPLSLFEAIILDTCPTVQLSLRSLSPPSSTYNYKWQKEGQLFSTNKSLIETFEQGGDFLLELITETDKGCSDIFEQIINIPYNPKAVINSSEKINCHHTELLLSNPSGKNDWSYQWRLSNGLATSERAPVFKFQESGSINVNLLVSNSSCFATVDTTITISNPPQLYVEILQKSQEIDQGVSLALPIISSADSPIIEWQPADGLNCTDCPMPLASPLKSIQYVVTIKDEQGCVAADSIFLTTNLNRKIFIPTSFSPNNDGSNDLFYPLANNPSIRRINTFRIYDRWGELYFEAFNCPISSPDCGWDGTFNGQPVQPGVYIYHIEIEFLDGERLHKAGDLTLFR